MDLSYFRNFPLVIYVHFVCPVFCPTVHVTEIGEMFDRDDNAYMYIYFNVYMTCSKVHNHLFYIFIIKLKGDVLSHILT